MQANCDKVYIQEQENPRCHPDQSVIPICCAICLPCCPGGRAGPGGTERPRHGRGPAAGRGRSRAVTREYTTRTSRPLPDSRVREFGLWIGQENWDILRGNLTSTEQAEKFKDITEQQLNKYFPTKECRVTNTDKPWVSSEIKKLDGWEKAEYLKNGKSNKYCSLLQAYNQKVDNAAKIHLKKNVSDLMQVNLQIQT